MKRPRFSKRFTALAVFVSLFLLPLTSFADPKMKLGTVNMARLLTEYHLTKAAQAEEGNASNESKILRATDAMDFGGRSIPRQGQPKFDPAQRSDMATMDKGGWLHRGRCANALVTPRITDLGEGAVYYDTPVEIR